MRAAVVREHGGVERVRVEDVPRPSIECQDDVIVRVRACSLNRLDIFVRKGLTGPGVRSIRLPHISGVDVAGEITEVGPEARAWSVGDRVVIYSALTCGRCEGCEAGEQTMCRSYRIFGEDTDGGLAEYCRIPRGNLELLPDHVSFEAAAALPAAYTTAWRMVVSTGRLRPDESILVLGAGGGVGCAAVQLGHILGARVFAVTRGSGRGRSVLAAGADRFIDRETEDFESVVRDETDGRGVDMVVNPVGGDTWRPAVRSLTFGGRMLICGATAGDAPEISIREIYQWHRQILGAPMGNRRDFRAVLDLLCRGRLEPFISAVLPLHEIREAHRLLEQGEIVGKVVVVNV
jgi:NADPH:quinone reductase-like Zn-dependent oxidoreductase